MLRRKIDSIKDNIKKKENKKRSPFFNVFKNYAMKGVAKSEEILEAFPSS